MLLFTLLVVDSLIIPSKNHICAKKHISKIGFLQRNRFRTQISTLVSDGSAYLHEIDIQRSLRSFSLRLSRGVLTQICARPGTTSGANTLLFSDLAKVTRQGHFCALVDTTDSLDSYSVQRAGVVLDRLVWVRCGLEMKRKGDRNSEVRSEAQNTDSKQRAKVEEMLIEQGDTLDQYQIFEHQLPKAGVHRYRPTQQQPHNKSKEERCVSRDRLCFGGQDANPQRAYRREIGNVEWRPRQSGVWRSSEGELPECDGQMQRRSRKKNRRFDVLEQAFKAADVLVQNGGFEMIAVDLSNVEEQKLRKVPLTTWFRFARVAEKTQTALVFIVPYPAAHLCAAFTVNMQIDTAYWEKGIAQRTETLGATALLTRTTKSFENCCQSREDEVLRTPSMQKHNSCAGPRHPDCLNEEKVRTNDAPQKAVKVFFHTHLLDGINCDMGIRQARKPMQQARPQFTAKAMWK